MRFLAPFQLSTLLLSLFIGTIIVPSAEAQAEQNTAPLPTIPPLQKRIPTDLLPPDTGFFTFTIENDSFADGRDQNYTNGLRLTYFDYSTKPPALAEWLDQFIPTFAINQTTSTYYSLGQNIYTPENIAARTPDPNDRPYAAFLYGSAGLTSLSGNHIDDIELTLGLVGPAALGKQTQNFVHDALNGTDPAGWNHQLKNEPGLILSWERQWPAALTGEYAGFNTRLAPHTGVALGNIYTYGAGGLTFQITPETSKWQSKPLRVRPAIPGNGFFAVPDNQWSWSLFAGTEGRAMARNIFLDGNSFRDSPSVDKKPFVLDANAGVSFTYGRTQLSYTLNWRSKEFDTQDAPSLFGALSLGYRF